jgi:hypothetical protein
MIKLTGVINRYRTTEFETTALDGVDFELGLCRATPRRVRWSPSAESLLNVIGRVALSCAR